MRSSSAWFTYEVTKLSVVFLPGWHCRWPPWPWCMVQTGCPWPCCPCWPSCSLWPVWPGPCAAQSRQARAAPAGKVTQPLALLLHSLPPQPTVRVQCILKPKHYVLYHQQLLIMIQKNIIDAKDHFTSNLLDYDSWCLIWERERVWSSLCLPRNLPRSHLSARSRPNLCLQHIILAGRTIFLMKTFCLQSSPW